MELLKTILETYRDEFELNLQESLTKTFQIDQSINVIRRELQNGGLIKTSEYSLNKQGNTFNLSIWNPIKLDLINRVIRIANNLGWFPSFLTIEKEADQGSYSGKWDINKIKEGDKQVHIKFEAKFDQEAGFKVPKYLYHVTTEESYKKIKRIGLSPKSRSKVTSHPDRIYLTKDIESAKHILNIFKSTTTGQLKNYIIVLINTELIPGDYLRLYKDPNYKERGYYTMNNIPPYAIEKVKDIEL